VRNVGGVHLCGSLVGGWSWGEGGVCLFSTECAECEKRPYSCVVLVLVGIIVGLCCVLVLIQCVTIYY